MQKIYPLGMLEAEDVADTIIFFIKRYEQKKLQANLYGYQPVMMVEV